MKQSGKIYFLCISTDQLTWLPSLVIHHHHHLIWQLLLSDLCFPYLYLENWKKKMKDTADLWFLIFFWVYIQHMIFDFYRMRITSISTSVSPKHVYEKMLKHVFHYIEDATGFLAKRSPLLIPWGCIWSPKRFQIAMVIWYNLKGIDEKRNCINFGICM